MEDTERHRLRMSMGLKPLDLEAARSNVGPGWHDMLPPIFDEAARQGVSIDDVKEKFGLLRVYCGFHSRSRGTAGLRTVDQVIRAAERRSGRTCEVCGFFGRPRLAPADAQERAQNWWVKTLCDRHAHAHYERGIPLDDLISEAESGERT